MRSPHSFRRHWKPRGDDARRSVSRAVADLHSRRDAAAHDIARAAASFTPSATRLADDALALALQARLAVGAEAVVTGRHQPERTARIRARELRFLPPNLVLPNRLLVDDATITRAHAELFAR